ncbi:MAG: transcriptional regulator BetI [Pseudomonadota bacterium]
MPKLGMEPVRRKALIDATISEIGAAGSLDVTVGRIAKRAGMSSGLAHHYFGSKEQIFLAAMRHILSLYGAEVRRALAIANNPRARVTAVVEASFHRHNFDPETVAAWLNFYVYAQTVPDAQRLLRVYSRRLHSNLMFALRQLLPDAEADQLTRVVASLIDGFYIRRALHKKSASRTEIIAIIEAVVDRHLGATP